MLKRWVIDRELAMVKMSNFGKISGLAAQLFNFGIFIL
jgi:hypothetical protein